ncbi:MAG: hypothetical protein ACREJ2_10415 [Planctomycetota bacterium]
MAPNTSTTPRKGRSSTRQDAVSNGATATPGGATRPPAATAPITREIRVQDTAPIYDAKGVWAGNQAWPSNRSLGQFALDAFRLENAKTDREKAFAFYTWLQRCMLRGPNLETDDGSGGYSRNFDPLMLLMSWGSNECTGWGWVADEALNMAGLRARRLAAHKMGHTFYEVWYRGIDGREQWHAFDPFIGWYFLNERGEVASCEELTRNPQLVQNPLPGHAVPLGHHPERGSTTHRHQCADQLFIEQPHRFEQLDWSLQKGQEVTFNWLPEAPSNVLFGNLSAAGPNARHVEGVHCDIPEISRRGELAFPQHEPYWKNYRWAPKFLGNANDGRPVRWHGSGALRWKPLQQGRRAAAHAIQAKFENGCLKPAGAHTFTEVWYRFQLPFLASYIYLDYDIVGDGGDYLGFCLSADDRRTIWPVEMKSHGPHWGVAQNGQAEWAARKPSVQGLRDFMLRIDMFSHSENPRLALQALNICVGFQHNMYVQPRLLPGANPLWLNARELASDAKLHAEWVCQVAGEQQREAVALDRAGQADKTVRVDAKAPPDVFMTGLKIACE